MRFGRGVDIYNEIVRFCWNQFGSMFAWKIRKCHLGRHANLNRCWHLNEVFMRVNSKTHYLRSVIGHKSEMPGVQDCA
jgi:putative transposase